MADLSCCFTGHRIISSQAVLPLYASLLKELQNLISLEYAHFYAGGALGFDTLAAQAVLQLKKTNPRIQLHLILPCKNQHSRWHAHQQEVYHQILASADSEEYVTEEYSAESMILRNRLLVQHSDFCLCYLQRTHRSGTAFTVQYARNRGLPIKNLAEDFPEQLSLFGDGY